MNTKSLLFAPIVAIKYLVGCDDGGAALRGKELRSEIDQMNSSLFDAQQATRRLEAQLEAARVESKKLEEAVKKAEDEAKATQGELETLKRDFDAYKSKYKVSIQSRVPGLELPNFDRNGVTYVGVKVSHLDNIQLAFSHAGGLAKLKLVELPHDILDVLGLTDGHKASFAVAADVKVLSAKAEKVQRKLDFDTEEQAAREKIQRLNEAVTAAIAEQFNCKDQIAHAKAIKHDTVRLSIKLSEIDQRRATLEAQRSAETVKLYEVTQRRRVVR